MAMVVPLQRAGLDRATLDLFIQELQCDGVVAFCLCSVATLLCVLCSVTT